jgi:hypothetical protein
MKEYGHYRLNLSKDRWVLEVMVHVGQKIVANRFVWMDGGKQEALQAADVGQ